MKLKALWKEFVQQLGELNLGLVILIPVLMLILLGLIILASASQSFSRGSQDILYRQFIWLGVGVVASVLIYIVDVDTMRRLTWWIAGTSLVMLFLVLIPGLGISVNGARRWLNLGFIRLQVSELAKFSLIFVLAEYLSKNQRYIHTFKRGFLIPSGIIFAVCFLIILEPDFGTAVLCGVVGFSILFLVGTPLKFLLPTLFCGGSVFFIAVLFDPVRLKRLTSFLDVEGNKLDGSYQLWQGILAFAAGGVKGVGLGQGRQQLSFLPEAHTDFIFPIIGEELGVFFTSGSVLLFFILFLVTYFSLSKASDIYYFVLVMGSLFCITIQALINLGVVTGLLPTKGMSLPFISYGGANLIFMLCLVALILNCLKRWSKIPLVKPNEI